MLAAGMAMQNADVAPTAAQVAACERARRQLADVLPRWKTLSTSALAALNARRHAAGERAVTIPG